MTPYSKKGGAYDRYRHGNFGKQARGSIKGGGHGGVGFHWRAGRYTEGSKFRGTMDNLPNARFSKRRKEEGMKQVFQSHMGGGKRVNRFNRILRVDRSRSDGKRGALIKKKMGRPGKTKKTSVGRTIFTKAALSKKQ